MAGRCGFEAVGGGVLVSHDDVKFLILNICFFFCFFLCVRVRENAYWYMADFWMRESAW